MGYSENGFRPDDSIQSEHKGPELRTQITMAAIERLRSWGMSDLLIYNLGQFTEPFDYGQVQPRMENFASRPIAVILRNDRHYVRIPEFFDARNSKAGPCSDLAYNWAAQSEASGLMSEIRDAVYEKHDSSTVDWVLCGGQSGEFFVHPSSTHVWVELLHSRRVYIEPQIKDLISKKNIGHTHKDIVERVIVDPAFQRIFIPEESPYRVRREVRNPGFELTHDLDLDLYLGSIETAIQKDETRITQKLIVPCIVGMGENGTYVYGFSWVRQRERRPLMTYISGKPYQPGFDPTIVPLLVRIDKTGHNQWFLRDPYRDDRYVVLVVDSRGRNFQGTPILRSDVPDVDTYMEILTGIQLRDSTHQVADPPRQSILHCVPHPNDHH